MKTDHVILVNQSDNIIGISEKIEAHKRSLLHRAFSVIVVNNKGEILLQQRSSQKYHSGGLWTNTCCSHPRFGEKIHDAAIRRLQEEMGIYTPLKELMTLIYKAPFDNGLTEHEYLHVFIGKTDLLPTINPDEVQNYRYQKSDEILNDMQKNPHFYTEWFKIIAKDVFKKIQN